MRYVFDRGHQAPSYTNALRGVSPKVPVRHKSSVDEENLVLGCGCIAATVYALLFLAFWALVAWGIYNLVIYLQAH